VSFDCFFGVRVQKRVIFNVFNSCDCFSAVPVQECIVFMQNFPLITDIKIVAGIPKF